MIMYCQGSHSALCRSNILSLAILTRKNMHPVTQELINKQCPNGPGIYQIYLCNMNGQPMTIQRAFGADASGLVYVGSSKTNLKERLTMFRRVASPQYRASGHSGAKKYLELREHLNEMFGPHELFFEIESLRDGDAAKNKEAKLLSATRMKYGDTPLLNG